MTNHQRIEELWQDFQQAIDAADAEGRGKSADGHAEVNALRDYASNHGGAWRLAQLVGRESANERQHRRTSVPPKSFSISDAARLHIMTSAAWGAAEERPAVHLFLTMRQTAAEAKVIGYLIRNHIPDGWMDAVLALDYCKLMNP